MGKPGKQGNGGYLDSLPVDEERNAIATRSAIPENQRTPNTTSSTLAKKTGNKPVGNQNWPKAPTKVRGSKEGDKQRNFLPGKQKQEIQS